MPFELAAYLQEEFVLPAEKSLNLFLRSFAQLDHEAQQFFAHGMIQIVNLTEQNKVYFNSVTVESGTAQNPISEVIDDLTAENLLAIFNDSSKQIIISIWAASNFGFYLHRDQQNYHFLHDEQILTRDNLEYLMLFKKSAKPGVRVSGLNTNLYQQTIRSFQFLRSAMNPSQVISQ